MRKRKLITKLDEDASFDEMDFGTDIEIDPDNIRQEAATHSEVYWQYGKLARIALRNEKEAVTAVAAAEEERKLKHARVAEKIRKAAEDVGEKLTVGAIENKTLIHPAYKKAVKSVQTAREAVIAASFEAGILTLAEKVLSKRTDLINMLGWSMRGHQGAEDHQFVDDTIEESKRKMREVTRKSQDRRKQNR